MPASYRELTVWVRAMELAEAVYRVSASFPADERYGLTQQIRRAAVSVPANIAEGHERRSRADYRRFVAIACGSVAEVETQVELARRLGYGVAAELTAVERFCDETTRMLRAIERTLRDEVRGEPAEYAAAAPQPSALSPRPSRCTTHS